MMTASSNGWGNTAGPAGGGQRRNYRGPAMALPRLSRDDANQIAFMQEMKKTADQLGMPLVDVVKKARTQGFLEGDDQALEDMCKSFETISSGPR